MSSSINRLLCHLRAAKPGFVSMPGDPAYATATAIWARPVDRSPRAVFHCHGAQDVQEALAVASRLDLPVSVRGGGHDWAGRALCEGIVIDMTRMNEVRVDHNSCTVSVGGGADANHVAAATDPFGLAPVTGSVGAVGMAGLTLGGDMAP